MMGQSQADVVERVVRERHSCRAFLPDPVPEETLQRMFDTAQRAPSWCGVQPWGVTLTSGQATRDFATALSSHAAADPQGLWHLTPPEGYYGVYQERRRATGWALYNSMGVTREDTEGRQALLMANYAFFGAPHVAVITTERDLGIYGAIDTGAYLGALTIIAQSLGLATIVQAAIAQYSPFVHDYFGMPPNRQIVCGISLGFEDVEHPINGFRTGREAIDNVVTRLG